MTAGEIEHAPLTLEEVERPRERIAGPRHPSLARPPGRRRAGYRDLPEARGSAAVAAALAGLAGAGRVVAIVSGGSIDAAELAGILSEGT